MVFGYLDGAELINPWKIVNLRGMFLSYFARNDELSLDCPLKTEGVTDGSGKPRNTLFGSKRVKSFSLQRMHSPPSPL